MDKVTVIHAKSGRSMDLSGNELEEYCRSHGLCHRCAKVKTHKRVVKLFGTSHKWEPITVTKSEPESSGTDDEALRKKKKNNNNRSRSRSRSDSDNKSAEMRMFLVYKGFCLSEGCYTLEQAKQLLGETTTETAATTTATTTTTTMRKRRGEITNDADDASSKGWRSRGSSARMSAARMLKRPGKRRTRTNPDTGSVIDESSTASMSTNVSGISSSTSHTRHSILSGLSGFSRIGSNISLGGHRNRSNKGRAKCHVPASNNSTGGDDVKGFDAESSRREPQNQNKHTQVEKRPVISPIVAHRVGQLVLYENLTVLDLNNIDMSPSTGSHNIDAVVNGIGATKLLEAITLERCGLGDQGIEKLADGLGAGGHIGSCQLSAPGGAGGLKTLRLRGNKIGNRGVRALESLFRLSSTLRELDLSDNSIGSMGASSVLESLAQNRNGVPLSLLNLSQNEIWELSPNYSNGDTPVDSRTISFFHTNSTLAELNLDGNLLHDGGAEYIAESIQTNKRCVLQKLYLGWNGIGDDGVRALAKAMESNDTLEVLGLAENDITNTGARALLASLAVNASVKEISGLYHNQIDRKFIIVAIKRLLHKKNELETEDDDPSVAERLNVPLPSSVENGPVMADLDAASNNDDDDDKEESIKQEVLLGSDPSTFSIVNEVSYRSLDSESEPKVVARTTNPVFPSTTSSSGRNLALEAIENWDRGTFEIDEVERKNSKDLDINVEISTTSRDEDQQSDNHDTGVRDAVNDVVCAISKKTKDPSDDAKRFVDRIVVFQAAPLAFFDRKTMQHVAVPFRDFDREARCLKDVCSEDKNIEVVFQNATPNNFKAFFAKSLSPLLHFSCDGAQAECLTLENGFGYMQALPFDSLKKMVATSKVQVVLISSCNSYSLADAFLKAGIPHVVSLQRETTFFDQGPVNFARGFYKSLQRKKSLLEAFHAGIEECKKHPSPPLLDKYQLLPEQSNHDVEIFFKQPPPPMTASITAKRSRNASILPEVPGQFVGREVDIYEILESLRVDDVIRVGGVPGSGKRSTLAVLSRYIADRSQSFEIDSIYWLPSPSRVSHCSDSLYEDLCRVMKWIVEAEDDIWDEEDYTETRERIMIEMEEQNSILIIDGRIFMNDIAGEMLERFLSCILNRVNVKIIMITASDESRAKTKRSRSEETSVHLRPLDFVSTVRLFGSACPLLSSNEKDHYSTIDTFEEFVTYMVPPSASEQISILDPKKPDMSCRQKELYHLMGKGNPRDIVQRAASCTQQELSALLRAAQQPEISIACSKELEEERAKWVKQREHAVRNKYFLRASDIEKALRELEGLRYIYPGLEEMKQKETELKMQFTDMLKAKRYEDANLVKRKLLSLKRSIMKEHSSSTLNSRASAAHESILEIQQRMQTMMALAESLGHSSSSFGAAIPTVNEELAEAEFSVSDKCTLKISAGCVWKDFLPAIKLRTGPNKSTVIVAWINEACDLSVDENLMSFANTQTQFSLSQKVNELRNIAETQWGSVKCATGECILINAGDGLRIVLAVPPLVGKDASYSCDNQSEYMAIQFRSTIRAAFRTVQRTNIKPSAIGISTIKLLHALPFDWNEKYGNGRNNGLYDSEILSLALNAIVDEIRHGHGQPLRTVHLFASSGVTESKVLIRIALEMGLPIRMRNEDKV